MIVSPSRVRRAPPPLPPAEKDRPFLNSANLLTLSRLPLAALVWIAPGDPWFVLLILVVAGITDILDGWVARRTGVAGTTGDWLDPLCDKTFVLSVLAAVGWAVQPPLTLLLLIASREIVQLPALALGRLLGLRRRRIAFRAAPIGKAATVAQFAALVSLLFDARWKEELAVVAGIVGLAAAVHYIARAVRAPADPVTNR